MPQDDEYLTVAEAAKLLKISTRTLRRHIKAGLLPARRLGKVYRLKRSDLDRALAVPPTQPTTAPATPQGEFRAKPSAAPRRQRPSRSK